MDFPLEPIDANGRRLAPGHAVTIVDVSSCARGLPEEDQARLRSLVGQQRNIVRIDPHGFVWLSFSPAERSDDFCLLPSEVAGE